MNDAELLAWLRCKVADAEKAVKSREQMESVLRSGEDESWCAAAQLHPSTAGQPAFKKAERLKEAEAQNRIAAKCRRELEMFKATLHRFELIERERER